MNTGGTLVPGPGIGQLASRRCLVVAVMVTTLSPMHRAPAWYGHKDPWHCDSGPKRPLKVKIERQQFPAIGKRVQDDSNKLL